MKFFFLITLFSFLFSCTDNKKDIPSGLLSKEIMVKILTDKHIAEAEHNLSMPEAGNPVDTVEVSKILEKLKIDSSDFGVSIRYYSAHPQMLNEIYDEVINELSRRQARLPRKK